MTRRFWVPKEAEQCPNGGVELGGKVYRYAWPVRDSAKGNAISSWHSERAGASRMSQRLNTFEAACPGGFVRRMK